MWNLRQKYSRFSLSYRWLFLHCPAWAVLLPNWLYLFDKFWDNHKFTKKKIGVDTETKTIEIESKNIKEINWYLYNQCITNLRQFSLLYSHYIFSFSVLFWLSSQYLLFLVTLWYSLKLSWELFFKQYILTPLPFNWSLFVHLLKCFRDVLHLKYL